MRWFGGFDGMKIFGVLLLIPFSMLPWYMFGEPFWLWSGIIWLMLATAFVDGVTLIDLGEAQIERTIRFLWLVPIWRRTIELRGRGEIHVTFKPSWLDRWKKWHERDFTTLDLRFGPHDWMQIAQTDRSKGNFDETLLSQARELASSMGVKLLVEVERVRGAIEYRDNSGQSPPPELRDNNALQATFEDSRA